MFLNHVWHPGLHPSDAHVLHYIKMCVFDFVARVSIKKVQYFYKPVQRTDTKYIRARIPMYEYIMVKRLLLSYDPDLFGGQ